MTDSSSPANVSLILKGLDALADAGALALDGTQKNWLSVWGDANRLFADLQGGFDWPGFVQQLKALPSDHAAWTDIEAHLAQKLQGTPLPANIKNKISDAVTLVEDTVMYVETGIALEKRWQGFLGA